MNVASVLRSGRPGLITAVPGFGVTSVWEGLGRPRLSYHEEVACGMAHGAALNGVRAASLMKTHGLLKAANAISSGLSCGVRAGLVHLVFEDPEARHSDNFLSAGPFLDALGLPQADLETAFDHSERLQLPVAVVLDGRTVAAETAPDPVVHPTTPTPPRDPQRHLVMPLFTAYQQQVLQARREGRDPEAIARPPLPALPDLPAMRPFFEEFRRHRPAFVAGDTTLASLFGLPPYECVDAVTCMGGSLPLALGALAAGLPEAWAVAGDFSFLSMGPLALLEAVQRDLPLKVLVVANGVAAATGGQPLDPRLLDLALAPYASQVRRLSPGDDPGPILAAMRQSRSLGLLVLDLPPV